MTDPATISLIGVGAVAINEGIKFLYGQAGDLLKRWRERKDKKAESSDKDVTEAVNLELPPTIFAGQLKNPRIHFDVLNASAKQLGDLRQKLVPYIDGTEDRDPHSPELQMELDQLRKLVESVYGQHITFKGESRAPSGTVITTRVDAGTVEGNASALTAREIQSGAKIDATATAKEVKAGGSLKGVEADVIR